MYFQIFINLYYYHHIIIIIFKLIGFLILKDFINILKLKMLIINKEINHINIKIIYFQIIHQTIHNIILLIYYLINQLILKSSYQNIKYRDYW